MRQRPRRPVPSFFRFYTLPLPPTKNKNGINDEKNKAGVADYEENEFICKKLTAQNIVVC